MQNYKTHLMSGTAILLFAGVAIMMTPKSSHAAASQITTQSQNQTANPTAQPRPGNAPIQLASGCNPCSPCGGCNPCNPCAANACNPCNPCAAKKKPNPCNPCGANPCAAANPCNPCAANPCAAANPCNPCAANPCAAANPCNPCAANPCAAANPCNPCAANPCAAANPCNPCNPCAAGDVAELNPCEAMGVYKSLNSSRAYAKSGLAVAKDYPSWRNFSSSPYQSATHGSRYVNNFVNDIGAAAYAKYEEIGKAPVGTVIAKDSFMASGNGKGKIGPLFVMEKLATGKNPGTGDWKYTMIMPNGNVVGTTGGKGSDKMQFCHECHAGVDEDQDYLFFLPEEFRN